MEHFTKTKTPYRQVRADYNEDTITVYQAYSDEIGSAAVAHQKLSASPAFSYTRMTWIKPSWTWMCYRAGYSYKDDRQACILALKMKHEHFQELLRHAYVGHGAADSKEQVRVQWDPERNVRNGKLGYRSIQIGISRSLSKKWVEEWIMSIEDVTDRARKFKMILDEGTEVSVDELIHTGVVPVERVYELPEDVRSILKMDDSDEEQEGKQSA